MPAVSHFILYVADQARSAAGAHGIPRAELYLLVQEPCDFHQRAVASGSTELSPLLTRDWGHSVAYSLDPDGHVLAFACLATPRVNEV